MMCPSIVSDRPPVRLSASFIIHLWLEELGGEKCEWRGRIQQIPCGEVGYFRDWGTLEKFLQESVVKAESPF